MRLGTKLYQFMLGRYGIDEFYYFFLYSYIVLVCFSIFLKVPYLFWVELILFVIMFYRVFSKNIARRKKENQIYLKVRKAIFKPFSNIKRNWKDRKEFIYKKCHKCKTTLRLPLPSKIGFNHVTCPKCKTKLTVFCFRKEKVEIIKADGAMHFQKKEKF